MSPAPAGGVEVVVAMAGHGQRFVDAGWSVPKPMIDVLGTPMFRIAVDALPLGPDDGLTFVVLDDHVRAGLATTIAEAYGEAARVVALPEPTRGQAETVLRAAEVLDPDRPLLIHNADTVCRFPRAALDLDADGALVVFEAPGDHWSFARLGEGTRVVEVAEKVRISPWASTGTYWFRSVGRFAALAGAAIEGARAVRGEYYVAPLYQDLLDQGGTVEAIVADEVEVLGTPAELEVYLDRRRG